jgi:hypothetical protein
MAIAGYLNVDALSFRDLDPEAKRKAMLLAEKDS